MKKLKRIIFLHSVFTERYTEKSQAISEAANMWAYNFLYSLKKKKIKILCAGVAFNPSWPKGNLIINPSDKSYSKKFFYKKISYINLPLVRQIYLYILYLNYLMKFSYKNGDLLVIFNKSFLSKLLYFINLVKKIPWICIVADLKLPNKADGYVFLSWNYFKNNKHKKKLFLDGGIYKFNQKITRIKKNKKIILYAGSIGEKNSKMDYTGLSNLLTAFSKLKNDNVNLWICGKGKSKDLDRFLKINKRVKYYGFVKKKKLIKLCQIADIFVNPRPSKINKYNFPSKILFYLNFNKPIISNKVGLHPKYNDVLFLLKNEKINTLIHAIEKVLLYDKKKLRIIKKKILNFKLQNSWSIQVNKFINWINSNNLFKHI